MKFTVMRDQFLGDKGTNPKVRYDADKAISDHSAVLFELLISPSL